MSPELKDLFQVGAWSAAIIGGWIAAQKALFEMNRANTQRAEDLRWKQAEMAKKCLDELFSDPLARAALKMLDWDGLPYTTPAGSKTQPISSVSRHRALRTENTEFGAEPDAPFIRDAFDALYDRLERFEHLIRIRLITFEDVKPAMAYYVALLTGPAEALTTMGFLEAYGFQLARAFLGRFEANAA